MITKETSLSIVFFVFKRLPGKNLHQKYCRRGGAQEEKGQGKAALRHLQNKTKKLFFTYTL